MAEMITRCPKCETAFRITPGHLRSARGSVRCGSCLQVFNAREHLTESSLQALAEAPTSAESQAQSRAPTPTPSYGSDSPQPDSPQPELPQSGSPQSEPALPESPESEAPPAAPTPGDPDDILISDDMGFADEESDAEEAFPPTMPREQTSLFERTPRQSGDEEDDESAEDESWALKLLDEDDPTPTEKLGAHPIADEDADDEYVHGSADYDLDEDEDDYREALLDTSNSYDEPSATDDELATAPAEGGNNSEAFEPQAIAASRRETTGSAYLDAIEPEPVEFAVRAERPFWRSRLLWGGLSLVALLALVAQVAWLQYPALNRIEPYRSFYAHACALLGCQLPPQIDLEAIRTSNLVVRSHPRQQNALMVDVVLQNTAAFAQPFPVLELRFSNLRSEVVAQRRFSPDDYLGGELAGHDMMPVRQPVHIAVEIVDPGPSAVNYSVEVVSSSGG